MRAEDNYVLNKGSGGEKGNNQYLEFVKFKEKLDRRWIRD